MEEKEFFSTAELPKAVTKETAAVFGGKATAVVKFINVADIMPDPESTPKIYPMEELARFALDILENGLKNPIALVSSSYKSKEIYRILSGEKRFRACLLARIERVPCTIIYPCGSDAERKELMMPPRDYFEEARIYAEAINRGLYTEEDIAEKSGTDVKEVRSLLSLLIFTGDEQKVLLDSGVPCATAKKLAAMDQHTRRGFLETIIHGTNIAAVCAKIGEASSGESHTNTQHRKFAIRNTGFFFNSINHAVETMREGGVNIDFHTQETDISTIMTLTVPKKDDVPHGTSK